MKRKETGVEKVALWQALRPRNVLEWVLLALFVLVAGALAFGFGLWVGGFVW